MTADRRAPADIISGPSKVGRDEKSQAMLRDAGLTMAVSRAEE